MFPDHVNLFCVSSLFHSTESGPGSFMEWGTCLEVFDVTLASVTRIGVVCASATADIQLESERFDGAPGQARHY